MNSWNDSDYRRAFAEGHERNKYVAGLIAAKGIWVDCPPLQFARTKQEIIQFTQHETDVRTRAGTIEVKGQGRLFTWDVSRFPYETQIIDTVESWEGKREKPIAYVMVCKKNMNCVVIPTKTRSEWKKKKIFDRLKKKTFEFYVADADVIVSFAALISHLRVKDKDWKVSPDMSSGRKNF
jgi:hypothetical protein